MLASQLVSAGDIEERHGLNAIAARYLNEAVDKTERLSNWEFELSEAQLQYAARDAAVLIPLRERLIDKIKSLGLIQCAQLEFECVMPVVDIELTGFYMNKAAGSSNWRLSKRRRLSWRMNCRRCWAKEWRKLRCLDHRARISISTRNSK